MQVGVLLDEMARSAVAGGSSWIGGSLHKFEQSMALPACAVKLSGNHPLYR